MTYEKGIHEGVDIDVYHEQPGVSKTGLFTIASKTPAHYKYGVRKAANHFDIGAATHDAILQPELFEKMWTKGPADRRGNKWSDFVAECTNRKTKPLTQGDFDEVLFIRDAVLANSTVRNIVSSKDAKVERSMFSEMYGDAHDGGAHPIDVRVRPDLELPSAGLVLDLKTTKSAHPDKFSKDTINYGYHVQEAFYSDVMRSLGLQVAGWLFLVVEKEAPYLSAIYELPPSIVEEGRAIYQDALDTYARCDLTGVWPGYPDEAVELPISRWAYRLTSAPTDEDEDEA